MTGIWATLGPSSLNLVDEMIQAGATGFRLTFSFGTFELQAARAAQIKRAAAKLGADCRVIADLPGGKFRLGAFTGENHLVVSEGQVLNARHADQANPADGFLPVSAREMFHGLVPGTELIIGDGSVCLEVLSADGVQASLLVTSGGTIEHTRGITVLGGTVEPESVTSADMRSLRRIAADTRFDAVAVSFVSTAADVDRVRSVLREFENPLPIVAKIESQGGMRNLREIAEAADEVMAARGDLGLAVPWADLPGAVEEIAKTTTRAGKPWVLATQVFEGMNEYAMPTRAEVCDLAHWLRRGCAAVLLSRETVFGPRPLAVVEAARHMIRRWAAEPNT